MKIEIELSGVKCTLENKNADDIHEAFELVMLALKGIGFHDKVIMRGLEQAIVNN